MFQTIKKYTLCLAELLIHVCFVIFYFFRFLFKGRPELKDPTEKLCIDSKPHCCLHPTAGTANYTNGTTANGTAGAKLSSHTDKMGRESTTKPTTTRGRMKAFWESVKSYLRWGYERLACGCRRVKNCCAGLISKLKNSKLGRALTWIASLFKRAFTWIASFFKPAFTWIASLFKRAFTWIVSLFKRAFTWIASFFKRSTSKSATDGSQMSAVPWRRVSYSDSAPLPASTSSAHSSSIPLPPPPPPSSVGNEHSWSNKSNFAKMPSWANADNQPKQPDSPKGNSVGGVTITTTTTTPIGSTKTVRRTDISDGPLTAVADNIATAELLSQSDQFNQDSSHATSSNKQAGNSNFAIISQQPKPASFIESSFLISSSTPSTPVNSSMADRSRVAEPEIQFPVYPNHHQPQVYRPNSAVLPDSSSRFKSPEPYRRTETAPPSGSRHSSASYFEHSATSTGGDSEPLLMGRSVYTPVLEAEEMRPIINRRSSATPALSDSRPASRASQTSRSYARSRTVEPRPYQRTTAAAEHQKYLANAQFEMSRTRDGSIPPVRSASRQWPPPSNATGPEIIKDLWMANIGPQMEPMELDPMTDPRALAQSWHAELLTTGGRDGPVIRNHFVSTSRGSYRESVYDQMWSVQQLRSVKQKHRLMLNKKKFTWMTSGETDDEGTINHRALRNPQGGVSDYHKLSKEYEVVMSNPERSVQLSAMLRGETGKGVDMLSRRREQTDKYAVEHQKASHRDIDPRALAESITDAAMRKSVEPHDWSRFSSHSAFDRTAARKLARRREEVDRYAVESRRTPLREIDPRELVESVHEAAMRKSVEPSDWSRMSTATPTVFAGAAYDCRSPTPFRPLSVAMNEARSSYDQNRLFSPQPADRPFSPSSENYNSMPKDWRSFRQKYH